MCSQSIPSLAVKLFLCETIAMIDATATVLRARAYLHDGGSKQALAEAANIHRNTLNGMEDQEWSPTFSTVRKIASGLEKLQVRA
jgi:DNA-binding XRE family transcriptional regulator